jgi:hypothetical protein
VTTTTCAALDLHDGARWGAVREREYRERDDTERGGKKEREGEGGRQCECVGYDEGKA